MNPQNELAFRHTMTNSSRKQQHCCCSNNSSIATDRAAAAAVVAAAVAAGAEAAAAAAAAAAPAAALCMHVKLTYRLLRRHLVPQASSYLSLHWKKEENKRRPSQI